MGTRDGRVLLTVPGQARAGDRGHLGMSEQSFDDLVAIVERRDQTLSHFGFERSELRTFARSLAGRGIARIVPSGSALIFAAVWDGHDLVRELACLTSIS